MKIQLALRGTSFLSNRWRKSSKGSSTPKKGRAAAQRKYRKQRCLHASLFKSLRWRYRAKHCLWCLACSDRRVCWDEFGERTKMVRCNGCQRFFRNNVRVDSRSRRFSVSSSVGCIQFVFPFLSQKFDSSN